MARRPDIPDYGKTVSFLMKQMKVDNAEDAKDIIKAINDCDGMETVELVGNTFGLPACEAIAAAIAKHKTVKHALLDDLFTRRKIPEIHPSLTAFQAAIRQSPCLTYVDFSDNALNPGGAEAVAPLIANCLTLKTLRLNNTGVGPAGGVTIGEALMEAFHNGEKAGTPYKLERFFLGRSRLEDPGAAAISEAFVKIGTLKEIRINNNGMYEKGALAISKAVSHSPDLEVLDLSDNALKTKASKALGKALAGCHKIKRLILESCLLKTVGGLAILGALENGHNDIEEIDLCYNEMTGKVATLAAKVLKGKPKLAKIGLTGNEFGDSGLAVLQSVFDESLLGTMSENESSGEEQSDSEDDDDDDDDEQEEEATSASKLDMNSLLAGLTFCGDQKAPVGDVLGKIIKAADKDTEAASLLGGLKGKSEALSEQYLSACTVNFGNDAEFQNVCRSANAILKFGFNSGVGINSSMINDILVGLKIIKGEDGWKNTSVAQLLQIWPVFTSSVKQEFFGDSMRQCVALMCSDEDIRKRLGTDGTYLNDNLKLDELRNAAVAACKK